MHHAYYFLIIEYSHFSSILYDFCARVRARGGVRYMHETALYEKLTTTSYIIQVGSKEVQPTLHASR